jgi:hypothetical protein
MDLQQNFPPFANDFPPDKIGPVKGFLNAAFAPARMNRSPSWSAPRVFTLSRSTKKFPVKFRHWKGSAQVEADSKLTQASMLARRAGCNSRSLTNGLAQGKTFAGICAAK